MMKWNRMLYSVTSPARISKKRTKLNTFLRAGRLRKKYMSWEGMVFIAGYLLEVSVPRGL
jgi:hypothetical protein